MEVGHLPAFPADLHLSGRSEREFDDLGVDHGESSNPVDTLLLQPAFACKHCFYMFDDLLRFFSGLCSQRLLCPANQRPARVGETEDRGPIGLSPRVVAVPGWPRGEQLVMEYEIRVQEPLNPFGKLIGAHEEIGGDGKIMPHDVQEPLQVILPPARTCLRELGHVLPEAVILGEAVQPGIGDSQQANILKVRLVLLTC